MFSKKKKKKEKIDEKKGKEGRKKYTPRRLKKKIFLRNVTRSLEAIEAKNKSNFEQPRREKEKEKKKEEK